MNKTEGKPGVHLFPQQALKLNNFLLLDHLGLKEVQSNAGAESLVNHKELLPPSVRTSTRSLQCVRHDESAEQLKCPELLTIDSTQLPDFDRKWSGIIMGEII